MYLFESLNQLIQTYLPEDQIKRLQQAYLVARDAHEGQTRSSGEPYITHPVAVACILAEMKLDYETLMAALLHDITANNYHRNNVPNSSKHKCKWLTYSSLAQVCKYANRVSYQVLNQHSPRLTRGLPEREDSLEEAYWDR
ncbi:MAG: HD domain-containing protein [Enterobacter hormaechei]|nr:HD domain-containing protein [Enterobacter hormaechei]